VIFDGISKGLITCFENTRWDQFHNNNAVYNLKQSFGKNVYLLNVAMVIDSVVKEGRY